MTKIAPRRRTACIIFDIGGGKPHRAGVPVIVELRQGLPTKYIGN